MKKLLLRDIVIPAGTMFHDAPSSTTRAPGHIVATIGFSPNTSGDLVYFVDDDPEEMAKWFADVPVRAG